LEVAGVRIGMEPHTYWSEVLEITHDCRAPETDLIVPVRAGSLTDAAEMVTLVRMTGVT
jgi:hypothetical protein